MPRYFLGAGFLALTAAAPLHALAADAPAPTAIVDPLVVTASRSGDATPSDLVAASVTVIDDQAMQDRQVRVVSDVLRDAPGVAVSRTGAVGGMTQVRLRGSEANQTLVLIDGIKASDPFFDEFDFGTIIADEAARIEVLRGQQSSLYGSDAIGGVISYTTLTGAEAPGVRLRAEGGSMGTYAGGARAAGVNGDLDYAVSASGLHTDGYPVAVGGHRNVGSDSAGASAKLVWAAAPNLRITAVGRYSYTDADTDDSDQNSASRTFGLTLDSPGVHYVNEAVYGLLRAELASPDGRWTNAASAQVADTRRSDFDVANAFAPAAGQAIVKVSGDHGTRFRESYESAYRFGDEHLKQRVTLAFDAEQTTSQTTVSPFGAFTGKERIDTTGLVGAYDLTVDDRASFGASVRHDWNSRFADDTTYRAQASYRFDGGTRVHAAAGSGVKDPSFSELFDFFAGRFIGNPNLQPEKSEGWEAGVDQTLLGGRAHVGATYFDNRLSNQITTSFATGVAMPVNLPGTDKQRGVELFADAQLSPDWRLDAAYTWLDAPQARSVILAGKFVTFDGQAVRRARDIASANLTWAPGGRPFSATLTVRYNGRQNDLAFTDPSFTPVLVSLKAFTLVNLGGTWKVNDTVELFGRVENLFDQSYQEVFSFAAPGRAAYGGVRLRF
ncbi:MAG TPA: TonB-dependent receptor [Phenylobacterium sp.]|jgi:vitamin B12 transporter|uniref:TonB-dependent receptor n=1 Tax=Phenylobacterium sp. TaxID=1871053 RepID=UPI002C4A8449|nr:TonB-dependent receptor [Phenylobacterium sp.]HXA39886.1 TonB-dependent receptor [Phenylobacterium sp.]